VCNPSQQRYPVFVLAVVYPPPLIINHLKKLQIMQKLTFEKQAKTIERTHSITGKVLYAEDYVASNNVPGVNIQLEGCPYNLRVLKGSIKGAGNAATVLGCTVTLTGIMRDYNGKSYFNPKDLTVDKKSGIATIAGAGVAYAGSLD